jgi:hypothetical protein
LYESQATHHLRAVFLPIVTAMRWLITSQILDAVAVVLADAVAEVPPANHRSSARRGSARRRCGSRFR